MSGTNNYFQKLRTTVDSVVANLASKGIDRRHLSFGGEGEPPQRKPTVPTDARSEFLANRAMGDWAEEKLHAALSDAFPDYWVAQYGDTDRIAAGHPEFRATYLKGLEATRMFGKRPDLLLFPERLSHDPAFSEHDDPKTDQIIRQAIAAIEVRSSNSRL